MTKSNFLELPAGVRLVYLAEGRANVVFRFVSASATLPVSPGNSHNNSDTVPSVNGSSVPDLPVQLRGKLLRLRKEIPSGISYQEITKNFDKVIRPLFSPEELVDQHLVCLPKGLVQHCNDLLRIGEKTGERPHKRHGVYLSVGEPMGLLVTDMTIFEHPGFSLAEFKPKWLLQSPSAPPNSRRCRTCALRDMKNKEAREAGKKEQRSFCPLDLVSDKFEDVLRAARFIKGCRDPVRLARALYRNSTLLKLKAHQAAINDVGLNGPLAQSREKSTAMILRDCTMYIKLSKDEKGSIEVRLGDLDLKTGAGGKAKYWLDLESRLILEGWYAGAHGGEKYNCECSLDARRR